MFWISGSDSLLLLWLLHTSGSFLGRTSSSLGGGGGDGVFFCGLITVITIFLYKEGSSLLVRCLGALLCLEPLDAQLFGCKY